MAGDNSTRERLLQGARKVFAEHGLMNATIRDICAQAGANVAAVSYHFSGKEKLYIAVLQDYIEQENRRNPHDLNVTPASPPEDRLRAYVRSFLLQTLGDGSIENERLGKLLTQEFIEPSQHFSEIFERFCRPTHNLLLDIVRQMLPGVEEPTVSRCASSIIGQCVLFDFAKEAMSRMNPELTLKASNIEHITDFIMEFSLGGIARLRAAKQPKPSGDPGTLKTDQDATMRCNEPSPSPQPSVAPLDSAPSGHPLSSPDKARQALAAEPDGQPQKRS